MKRKFIIAGTGFRGFCDALALSKLPDTEVTLIEAAPFFGGLMNSLEIDGFFVDKGVHVFDSIPVELADIVTEIQEGQTSEIDFVSESAFNGKVTQGYSLPDLDSLDDATVKNKIKNELIELSKTQETLSPPRNLHQFFAQRYGATAGQIFSDIFKKVYSINADEV